MPQLGLPPSGNSYSLRTHSSAGTDTGEHALLHGPGSHLDMDRDLNGRTSGPSPFESSAMKEVCIRHALEDEDSTWDAMLPS